MNNSFKIALIGAVCAFPSLASACSCMSPPAPKVALANSAAVFVGRVTSVEKGEFSNKFQFAISKQWKGVKGKSASIVTATSSAACGINFDSDRDYLVYAFKTEGDDQLRTNLCTRTTRAADATTDMAELGAPVATVAAPAMTYPTDDSGVVHINVGSNSDPMVVLGKALRSNQNSSVFRVNWKAPTSDTFNGTALYNRNDSTLKAYSRSETGGQINVSSVLYSGVTDEVLQKLGSTEKTEEFFRTYAKYGVTKKDVGSKTVRFPQ